MEHLIECFRGIQLLKAGLKFVGNERSMLSMDIANIYDKTTRGTQVYIHVIVD